MKPKIKAAGKISVAALLLSISLNSTGQDYTSKGTIDLGGDFAFSFQKSTAEGQLSFTTFSFNAFLGAMLLPGFELAFNPTVSGYNSGGNNNSEFGIYLSPSYNFTTKSNVYPYIEMLAGYGLYDNGVGNSNVVGLGGDAGIKVKLRESALLLVKIEYLRQFFDFNNQNDLYYSSQSMNYNLDAVTFGIGFRFFIARAPAKN